MLYLLAYVRVLSVGSFKVSVKLEAVMVAGSNAYCYEI